MWITYTSTPSNMVWCNKRRIGRIHRFTGLLQPEFCRMIGRECPEFKRIAVNLSPAINPQILL